jgi:hypothetical protein
MPNFAMHVMDDDPVKGNFCRLRRNETVIAKVQISMWSSTGERRVLIYDQHKKKLWLIIPTTPELTKLFGERLKFFAEVWLEGTELIIGKEVRDRPW